jgi:adenosylcobinamide kinase / adenosylcobinamide-phosphate guanylyltransferase
MTSRKILITGGQRSGKSRYAESLLADQAQVTYIAPGPIPDPARDAEWAARIGAHQDRRPATWTTVETTDLPAALRAAAPPVLIDCVGTWLTATVDHLGTWDTPLDQWRAAFHDRLAALLAAWQDADGLVIAVTNEVGMGLVSERRSGRVFTDLLGRVNQDVAALSDEVVFMVAGRPLRL